MSELKIIIGNKRYSSWSLRGWLALEHAGLSYEEILLELDTPEFFEEIVKYNPAKKVPTLLDGDTAVWDSAAIIEYCARLAPEKFWWPEDKKAYALAISIFNEMHSGFFEIRGNMPMNLNDKWENLTFGDALQNEINRMESLWTEGREKFGANGDFLFGNFSAVDIMFAPITTRFATYGVKVNDTAVSYIEAVRNHPSVAAWYEAASKETRIVDIDQLGAGITHLG